MNPRVYETPEVWTVVRSHGKTFELVPHDFRMANLRSAPRHPLRALLLAAFIPWRLRAGRRRGR